MFILNPYTKVKLPLILEIDTTKTGVTPSNGFEIPASAPLEVYSYKVDWGDGTKTSGHTGITSHTYAVGGVYQVKIYGKFPRMYFNNGGDRLKILKIQDWGEINYSTNQGNAFWGCNNLDHIAKDDINAWYNGLDSASSMFRNCPLTTIPDNMTLDSLVNGFNTFATSIHLGLTSLPSGMTLANLTNGTSMFFGNSLTSLPDGMTLASLTNGTSMFFGNYLTSLPDGMTLASLTNGNTMFRGDSLTSLPDGMTLASLTNGTEMFYNNSLTSLPSGMTLANLTNGTEMFRGNSLTNVDNLTLTNCANLTAFVRDNPNFNGQINVGTQVLTSISALGWDNKWSQDMSAWVFSPNCSFGNASFNPSLSNSIDFTNEHWGKLLIRVNALCGAGSGRTAAKVLGVRNTVKYPASAAAARMALVADGWDIRDGGAE